MAERITINVFYILLLVAVGHFAGQNMQIACGFGLILGIINYK